MSADDYIKYSIKNEFMPSTKFEETGQLCHSNMDCRFSNSCVNNKCVMGMRVSDTLPFTNRDPYPNGNAWSFNGQNANANGAACLSGQDCKSNYCGSTFTCLPKMPNYAVYSSYGNIQTSVPKDMAAMTRCYTNADCGTNGNCVNWSCQ
jgi:hypothetical protein